MDLNPKSSCLPLADNAPVGMCIPSESATTLHPISTVRSLLNKMMVPTVATLLSFFFYLTTLAPTVTSEDSGELIGAAYHFGVAHPPGYPLWTILCGIFIKIVPMGSIAWRANLFSAVCTAIGIGILCRSLIWTGLRATPALSGSLICALGTVLWSQSVITEVYALHFLIFILLIWCAIRWRQQEKSRWLVLASLLLGLGMSNHQTIGFTGVAIAMWVVLQRSCILKNWRLILLSALAFFAGLLPHIYLYLRAQVSPPINWGHTTTLPALWDHISRRQYKASNPPSQVWSFEKLKGQVELIAHYCLHEYTPVLAFLSIPGFCVLALRKNRPFLLFWILLVVCNSGLHLIATGMNYKTRQDQWANQVFFIPVYTCLAASIAVGIACMQALVLFAFAKCLPVLARRAKVPIACLLTCVAAIPLIANYSQNNLRQYWYAYDHAKNILDTLLPNAMIFPSGDHNTFPLLYLVYVEGYRSDIVVADKYGYIDLDLYATMPENPGKPRTRFDRDRIEEWVIRNARRPVYYTVKNPPPVPHARQVPVGIVYHLLPEGKAIDTESAWPKYHYRNLEGLNAPQDFGAVNILSDWEFFQGIHLLEQTKPVGAMKHFERCRIISYGTKEILNNIGSALAEYGYDQEAVRFYEDAAQTDRVYEAPRWNLARIYKSQKRFDLAEGVFKELADANPDDFRVWGELGFLALYSETKTGEAIGYWEKSIRLNPLQPQIIEQMHHYYSALKVNGSTGQISASRPEDLGLPNLPNIVSQPSDSQVSFGSNRGWD